MGGIFPSFIRSKSDFNASGEYFLSGAKDAVDLDGARMLLEQEPSMSKSQIIGKQKIMSILFFITNLLQNVRSGGIIIDQMAGFFLLQPATRHLQPAT
jgi:hypothetical protein